MVEIRKSKSELRAESEKALAEFLSRGGSVEVVPARRRKVKHTVASKSTRSFTGSSGSLGYRTSGVFK